MDIAKAVIFGWSAFCVLIFAFLGANVLSFILGLFLWFMVAVPTGIIGLMNKPAAVTNAAAAHTAATTPAAPKIEEPRVFKL